MSFVNIVRHFCGFVTFSADSGFPDKFLNACRLYGVNLFNMHRENGVIKADVLLTDYRKMVKIRRGSDMRIRILERHGVPFFIHNHRNRVGLVVGCALFILLISLLSGYVWSYSVEGNETIDENDIIKAFEENGVKVGTHFNSIDITDVEDSVKEKIPKLVWVSLNISGGNAVIKVREGTEIPNLKNSNPPCNILAKYSGQITTYEVYEGVAEKEVHAAVLEGDLLVSGILTYADGTTVLRPADGKIEAKTERKVEAVINQDFALFSVSEMNKSYILNFFGGRFPIPLYDFWEKRDIVLKTEFEEYILLGDRILPVGLTDTNSICTSKIPYESSSRMLSIGLDRFFKSQMSQMKDAKIEKNEIKISVDENAISYVGTFRSIEDICDKHEILYSEQG